MIYKKLLEKEKRLELHAITLSDYWRKNMIPRGLRINKFPSFGKENLSFRNEWERILNKCSLDLMLLLIKEAKVQRAELRQQIEEAKTFVFSNCVATGEDPATLENQLRDQINELSQTLTKIKINKFKRDQQDYTDGQVYTWQRHTRPLRRTSSVSFNLPSSATSDEDESTQTQGNFLGTRVEARRGGAERGRGRGWDLQPRPSLPRNTKTKKR
ncbi:hypothetical protein ACEWY4_024569 [Coilia grayii]|uniref:Uncharacterized protein n=1 Tax=Coilia grayii TaxID=363190 RepID=A0ABD1J2B4_9TELE